MLLHSLMSADALGRLEYASLPQQTLMELVVGNAFERTRTKMFLDPAGDFRDACTWDRVQCTDKNEVTRVLWRGIDLGQVDLEWLPPMCREFQAIDCLIAGTLPFASLPVSLAALGLSQNQLEGPICLDELHDGFHVLDLSFNLFSGTVDFTKMPGNLALLQINRNKLHGSVDLSALPHKLQLLGLQDNQFSGCVDLSRLPGSLEQLYLQDNAFHGEVDLQHLPEKLETIILTGNGFSGELHLDSLPASLRIALLNKNEFSGCADASALPEEMFELSLADNKLHTIIVGEVRDGRFVRTEGNEGCIVKESVDREA